MKSVRIGSRAPGIFAPSSDQGRHGSWLHCVHGAGQAAEFLFLPAVDASDDENRQRRGKDFGEIGQDRRHACQMKDGQIIPGCEPDAKGGHAEPVHDEPEGPPPAEHGRPAVVLPRGWLKRGRVAGFPRLLYSLIRPEEVQYRDEEIANRPAW